MHVTIYCSQSNILLEGPPVAIAKYQQLHHFLYCMAIAHHDLIAKAHKLQYAIHVVFTAHPDTYSYFNIITLIWGTL